MDKIYLIGFMGSGKTSVGKKLAKKLNYKFIDLDTEIEKSVNCSISDYFTKFGEEKFREIENKILKESFKYSNTVISTGGGTPCFFNNMLLINKNSFSIYLKADVKLLSHRLINAKQTRPLIKNKSKEELEIYIEKLLSEREIFYNKAKLVIDAKSISIDNIVKEINKTISDKLRFLNQS